MITAEELAKEIARLDAEYGDREDVADSKYLAEHLLPFIQSRAAGAQGASDGPLSSRLRPDVECAPWVIEEVKKLERRLATPQPPKDAGAVPLPKMVGMISDRPICFQDEVARYGNAREAAGRADAVPEGLPVHPYVRARTLLTLLWQKYDAGGVSMGRSFEAVCLEAAMDLLEDFRDADDVERCEGSGNLMDDTRTYLSRQRAKREGLDTVPPQHPPAEPAARAQVAVSQQQIDAGTLALIEFRKSGADWTTKPMHAAEAVLIAVAAINQARAGAHVGEPTCSRRCSETSECDGSCAPVAAHPSPAHAGAGDAEALKLASKIGVFYHNGKVSLGAPLYAFTPNELTEFARRLAGGDHGA